MTVSYDPHADAYRLLEVDPEACREVVAAAHRTLSKIHHPDTGGSVSRMASINGAFDVLRNPVTRAAYDSARRAYVQTRTPPPPPSVRLGFGKYKGMSIADVPTDYLLWCRGNLENAAILFDVTTELERRGWL